MMSWQSILITDCEEFAEKVIKEIKQLLKKISRREIASKSWNKYGAVIIVKKLINGIDLVNRLAPEH